MNLLMAGSERRDLTFFIVTLIQFESLLEIVLILGLEKYLTASHGEKRVELLDVLEWIRGRAHT